MKRRNLAVTATALLTGIALVVSAQSASADFTPSTKDVVGVGSDTTETVVNLVADGARVGPVLYPGYNGGADARLVSFNATNPVTGLPNDSIVLKVGTTVITRPNGSGAGKNLLHGATNNVSVNFARSSSSLSAAEVTDGLWQFPYAKDSLQMAVSASATAPTNAPATLSAAQILGIYNGTFTTWNQVGGTSTAAIVPLIPQSGSGTRSFFTTELKRMNGGVDVVLAPTVQPMQEHDPALIKDNPNAIGPFSTARASFETATIKLAGGYAAERAVYNVVRGADLAKPFVGSIFGPAGYICSTSGKRFIEAAGFKQLASQANGGVCGVPTQSATTNLTLS